MYLLESPLFNQILTIQDSITQLRKLQTQRPLGTEEFDFDPASGELLLTLHDEDWDSGGPQDAGYTTAGGASSTESISHAYPSEPAEELETAIEALAQGRVVETVVLHKEDKSLGFSVVGLRSEHRGELGIFIQEIQPGGIAAR